MQDIPSVDFEVLDQNEILMRTVTLAHAQDIVVVCKYPDVA
jgi:hypothetical protein